MGHKCEYFGKLKTTEKDIYIEIEARYKDKRATVYKEHLNGKAECRYIYYSRIAGNLVTFPNEPIKSWYYGYMLIQQKERFSKCDPFVLYVNWETKEADKERLLKLRPELKYFLKKEQIPNIYNFIRVLAKYIDHPEIEPLIELGLNAMVLDKRLYKLTTQKKNAVREQILRHKDQIHDELSLSTIFTWIKHGFSYKKNKYQGIADYNPHEEIIGGYKIFIPNEIALCERQANALHQCIMKCSYVSDMAKHKTVLIFMAKDDGTPIATCQINHQKEIQQFYANELDRNNCLPTKSMKEAMNVYLNTLDMSKLYVGV